LSAEAVSPVSLIAYPRAAFETLALINPRVKSEMMEYMARSLMRAQGQLFVLNCQGARERLASFLLRMHGQGQLAYGDRLDLPMGRQDIADHLGLSVETVSRTFTALRRSGLIEIVNTQLVIIKNLPALRLLAEGL
jgi:cAMP-binding proteins - catabolite gene activator and regulatory subunit of cAMP-dependent protein kinases